MLNRLQTIIERYANQLAASLMIIFLISGVLTLPLYGMSWDEGLGNFFFGERYLQYWTHFQEKYLDFKAELPFHSEHALNLFQSPFRNSPQEFPALADTASAATMYIFSYGLDWMNPVDGFHAFTIILTSVFLYVFYRFTAARTGKLSAFFALLFLVTFPRLWGDMHINVKDVPEMVAFGLALMAFWKWSENPTWKRAVLVGIAAGAALGIKANALFIPVVAILGTWTLHPARLFSHIKKFLLHYLIMLAGMLVIYFFSWPYVFTDPKNATKYFEYIFSQGGRAASSGWSWQPIEMVTATMPEIMLIGLLIGLVWAGLCIFRKQGQFMRYALAWCFIPILRICLPPSLNFDGIRHFLEFLPGAALLAGVGISALVDRVSRHWTALKLPASGIVASLILFFTGMNFINFGAYQYIYFNNLTGGMQGAASHFGSSEATDYWAVSYRQGIEWLNQNAPANSSLHVPIASHLVQLTAPLWLRSDIHLINEEALIEGRNHYVMFVTRPQFYNGVIEDCLASHPIPYQIAVQDTPILMICSW